MNNKLREEVEKIISEGWTDGMAALWGTPEKTDSIFSGIISGSDNLPVSNDTVYDLASVTKIFFLICILKLVERGTISLDASVGEYSDRFPNISGLKIYELMNFSKPLQTSRRIDSCDSYDEAVSVLQNVQLVDGMPKYSDMGAIILSLILNDIPKASFRKLLSEIKELCALKDTYFWDELPSEYLTHTQSYDKEYILKDNRVSIKDTPIGIPHDSKARILGACGHAGIFSTPRDITIFCQSLLSERIISRKTLSLVCLSKYDTYVDEQHFGLLCYKKSTNQKKSEVPALFSDASFAISGFTGTYILIDPENNYFVSINSNRIYNRCTSNESIPIDMMCTKNYVYRKDELIRQIIPAN
ncbi:MAG: serine hydrolase [Lachnospiraceae bacterium]|nr:serine hydrolase [Lachnospiraceae bacterium]